MYIKFCLIICLAKFSDKLIGLVLKVAKDQGLCLPGSKVIIFYTENEGKKNESVNFKLVEIEGNE
jgi:hypothetical protein